MKKATKGSTQKEEISDKDSELQAIILADNFSNKFWPITLEGSRALIPLGNVTLIDYAIQFLLINKIRNIIIFVSSYIELLEEYFHKYKSKEFSLKIVSSEDCLSMGDALRNIERMGIITGDFILMRCDLVANFKLERAIVHHKMKKTENKANIMTRIYKKLPYGHPLRTEDDDIAFVFDQYTSQIVQIESLKNNKTLEVKHKMDWKQGSNNYKILYDLYDTNVAICSIDVLHHFMDNFDFNNIRDDYIKDLLTSEISDDKINMCIIGDDEYAATVSDLRVYKHVLQDLVAQWVSPLVIHRLGTKIKEKTQYQYYADNLYIAADIERSLNGVLSNNCVIGKGTKFAEKVNIFRSSIGSDCKIGKNVKINDSVIWDNVTIEDNCVIEHSLLCSNVVVKANSILERGCVLSYGVIVKEMTKLPPFSIISCKNSNKTDNLDNGFEKGGIFDKNNQKMTESFAAELKNADDSFLDSESLISDNGSENSDDFVGVDFQKEVVETIKRVVSKESSMQTVIFEVNNLKFGENKTFSDCLKAFMPEILSELLKIENNAPVEFLTKSIKELIKFWQPLIHEYSQSLEDSIVLISEIQDFCAKNQRFKNCFHVVLQLLFVEKVVDGDKILHWAKEKSNDESSKYFLDLCERFLQYLKSLNEEDEENDDEEGEEEEN